VETVKEMCPLGREKKFGVVQPVGGVVVGNCTPKRTRPKAKLEKKPRGPDGKSKTHKVAKPEK